ncbi:winged helix-turn-helix domain-containing protein [Elizabethkingia anophelis]|uniref:winged helix-turn-helix domain-containing protein n=1 Tax=Elizabethkingia anophelis TaxID=1117645 RepID=UPI003555D0EF
MKANSKTQNKTIASANNKGLQKLTESEAKFNSVLSLEKITYDDVKDFNEEEKIQFGEIIQARYHELTGIDKEDFFEKIKAVITEDTRNEVWENNHLSIMWAISTLLQENGRMPTKAEISLKTNLSRQTVYKHLKEYRDNPFNEMFQDQFAFMYPKVLSTVFNHAVNGDMKAAKLYFEFSGVNKIGHHGTGMTNNNTLVQNQNNYIQINGMVLNQETVKNFTPEQLDIIEGILKTVSPLNGRQKTRKE